MVLECNKVHQIAPNKHIDDHFTCVTYPHLCLITCIINTCINKTRFTVGAWCFKCFFVISEATDLPVKSDSDVMFCLQSN